MNKQYKVGIYCRLSIEDSANSAKVKAYLPPNESVSIENQYELLSKITMVNGWTEIKSYRDDGYSGGNFQRPGFLEMLEDARHGIINLILVKDLSRLGRDFVEVGRYTDVVFPSLGCRFVSVLDCLDSEGDNTDMLHFRSLMNDYHLKDLSGKIKSVLHAKMRQGQYIAAYAPYGYKKSEDDPHKLVIDEEAAGVVQWIFKLRQDGMAYGKIVAALNQENILSPRWYWAIHYGNGSCRNTKLWQYATVKLMLNNPVYLGNLTQNTTGTRSYKDKTMVSKPEADWIVHEAIHEAIISQEVWDNVQERNRKAAQIAVNSAPPSPSLFSGKLVCADCGSNLGVNREKQRRKNGTVKQYVSYICMRFASSGRSICSWHRIYEITLSQIVINEIRTCAQALEMDEASILDKLKKRLSADDSKRQKDSLEEIGRLRRRVFELEQITAKLYEDKVTGVISTDSFSVLIQKSEHERLEKTERMEKLQSEINRYAQCSANIQKWADMIHKYLNLQELDREIVEELIDHIEIGERTVIDGQRQQDIKIYYRFVGRICD